MKQQSLAIVALMVIVAGVAASQFFKQEPVSQPAAVSVDGTHLVTLTNDGFVPASLTIHLGETVTFRNKTGKLFWPASNLHPSHLIYSEFDPKEPVQPDATWSFTFNREGAWEYHDHLAPYYTGVITVVP